MDVAELSASKILEALRQKLQYRVRESIDLAPTWSRAAVLVPVVATPDGLSLLFTRRTETVLAHKGQISFPGGQHEPGDETLLETALRETDEEIGLQPERVTLLGELDDVVTSVSGFVIAPFVGTVSGDLSDLRPAPNEVKSLLLVPVDRLRDPSVHHADDRMLDGKPFPIHYYTVGEDVIWGATARILYQLLTMWES